jgi:hypothetical protein
MGWPHLATAAVLLPQPALPPHLAVATTLLFNPSSGGGVGWGATSGGASDLSSGLMDSMNLALVLMDPASSSVYPPFDRGSSAGTAR